MIKNIGTFALVRLCSSLLVVIVQAQQQGDEQEEYYPTNPELTGWVWQYGIFQIPSLIVILVVPIILWIFSWIIFCQKKNLCRLWCKTRERWKQIFSPSNIRKGLRIDTYSLDVKKLVEEEEILERKERNENQMPMDRDGKEYEIHPGSNITEQDMRNAYRNHMMARNVYMSSSTHNIKASTSTIVDDDEGIVVFFRLASIFVSSGMSTIENEVCLKQVGIALGLPPLSLLNLGLGEITAQFELGPIVNILCSTEDFYQLSLLSRAQQLAKLVIDRGPSTTRRSRNAEQKDNAPQKKHTQGDTAVETPTFSPIDSEQREGQSEQIHHDKKEEHGDGEILDSRIYLRVLDRLVSRQYGARDPYGKLVCWIAMYVVCTIAPLTVYNGGYANLFWASIISLAIVVELVLIQSILPSSASGQWTVPLVSFTTGILSPILWQSTHEWFDGADQCSAHYTIGVLLIWFPGSSLVYGAYEVCLCSYHNGSARLVKGIVSAMVIALFYTIGWQYWGRNWTSDEFRDGEPTNLYNTTGPIASLPPSIGCSDDWAGNLPWYVNAVLFAIPLNLATMVIFNIRIGDCIGPFLVAQLTYFVQGILGLCNDDTCALPTYVTVFVVAFSGGVFAEINQMITGFSKV